ncbi:hypothetical protein [Paenibacillus sp. L3-i20]|uniref:hypothetical protein n=1 Tax=Paenibacillus sp. L3-i20 TaxID=2905833 RepID=UPI001EDF435B|nr:hypothetical protein [Paenibacillus sp. L3-i20]GKU79191.1 hypothetical protein L3i20_v235880 [Paenibacillus sp. L3-i20]
MKKILIVVLAVFLSACSSTTKETFAKEESFKEGIFQKNDLAFYDLSNNIKINFGMKKTDVEKLIGQPTKTLDYIRLFEYSGISVHYRDDKVSGLILNSEYDNFDKFITPRGIKMGDNLDIIISKYGNSFIKKEKYNIITLTYFFEKVKGEFKTITSFKEARDTKNAYSLSMVILKDIGLSYLMIADHLYSTNPTGK